MKVLALGVLLMVAGGCVSQGSGESDLWKVVAQSYAEKECAKLTSRADDRELCTTVAGKIVTVATARAQKLLAKSEAVR